MLLGAWERDPHDRPWNRLLSLGTWLASPLFCFPEPCAGTSQAQSTAQWTKDMMSVFTKNSTLIIPLGANGSHEIACPGCSSCY